MASGTRGPLQLVRAAKAGDAQLVARLLSEGRDVNEAGESGFTALNWASHEGHVEVVRLLLARQDVEVNKSAADGLTALFICVAEWLLTSRRCGSCSRAWASRSTRPRRTGSRR